MEMGILDYCFYAALGLTVVFLALIFLMIVLKIMGMDFKKPAPAAEAGTAAAAPAGPKADPAPGTAGELKLYDTDPRDAAMVMAIVADELGKPLNELRFTSIREVQK